MFHPGYASSIFSTKRVACMASFIFPHFLKHFPVRAHTFPVTTADVLIYPNPADVVLIAHGMTCNGMSYGTMCDHGISCVV